MTRIEEIDAELDTLTPDFSIATGDVDDVSRSATDLRAGELLAEKRLLQEGRV